MNDDTSSQYLHGTRPDEQRRLSLLNDLLNAGSLREMRLRGDERVLDVGSARARNQASKVNLLFSIFGIPAVLARRLV